MTNSINKLGVIESVFSKAIYIRLDQKLITLTAGQANFLYGVILSFEDISFLKKVCSKDIVLFNNHSIDFPKQSIKLDFSKAIIWVPGIFPNCAVNQHQVHLNLEVLKSHLLNSPDQGGLVGIVKNIDPHCGLNRISGLDTENLNLYCQFALPVLSFITHNWSLRLYENAMSFATKLIGLGPGLTPSGDDFLVGMLSSIYGGLGLCQSTHKLRLLASLKNLATTKDNITTEVSRDLLNEASIGKFPESLYNLSCALFFGSKNETSICAKKVAKIGATSGLDIGLGVYFGCILMMMLKNDKRIQ